MKKLVLAAICVIGFQSASFAQEEVVEMTSSSSSTENDSVYCKKGKINFYAAFGAAFVGDYKISDKLRAAGVSRMPDALPEFSVGYNVDMGKWMMDFEVNGNYSDEKNAVNRVRTAGFGAKLRWHYVPYRTKSFFLSTGADISYLGTQMDIFRRGNVIDLNDLDPSDHSGHISINNGLLYAGPSVAFGFLQNKFPLRLNIGYEWGLTNGKWRSDFADVNNTVKESGHGRAYAKLTLGL